MYLHVTMGGLHVSNAIMNTPAREIPQFAVTSGRFCLLAESSEVFM